MASNEDGSPPRVKTVDLMEVVNLSNAITYYLNLRLMAQAKGVTVEIPPEVDQIVELAKKLREPEYDSWGLLLKGKLELAEKPKTKGAKGKAAAAAKAPADGSQAAAGGETGTVDKKRKRMIWTDEVREELVRLVDDEEHRSQVLGKAVLNWSSIARQLGFSGAPVVHRQYNLLKGIELPSAAKPKQVAAESAAAAAAAPAAAAAAPAAAAAAPAAAAAAPAVAEAAKADKGEAKPAMKKAKKEKAGEQPAPMPARPTPAKPTPAKPPPAKPSPAKAPVLEPSASAAPSAPADGWSAAQTEELLRLVKDPGLRKRVLGKSKLKWGRLAEHFGKTKKETKRKYTQLTGKEVE